MNKNFMYGMIAGVALVWGLKNLPVVSPVAAPVLGKVGL